MKKLKKKLILVLNFAGLTVKQKIEKMTAIKTAHADNPTIVPNLLPTTTTVEDLITEVYGLFAEHDVVAGQLTTITSKINQKTDALVDIYVSKWATETQIAIAGDETLAKKLNYDIKGDVAPSGKLEDTAPSIIEISNNKHGWHDLKIINIDSQKKRLPKGALRIDIYGQTGGTEPTDLASLIANGGGYLGEATKGKFRHEFPSGNKGKTEFYIAVYISKKTKKPVSQSLVVGEIIT
ncbi:MAG: hypothetical protein WCH34_11940 [Bacteroidota bacterium]